MARAAAMAMMTQIEHPSGSEGSTGLFGACGDAPTSREAEAFP